MCECDINLNECFETIPLVARPPSAHSSTFLRDGGTNWLTCRGIDYVDEMAVIPKNAQVVVRRVPAAGGGRRPPVAGPGSGRSYVRPFVPSSSGFAGAAGASGNEEERSIRAMMQATSSHWEQNQQEMPLQQAGPRRQFRPSNYGRGMPNAVPPDTYVCFRCGQKGMKTRKKPRSLYLA